MNIDILTIHRQTNFGSVMQAFALTLFLNKSGYQAEVLDYRPAYIENPDGKSAKKFIKSFLFGRSLREVRKKYNQFIKDNIPLSDKTYKTYEDLCQHFIPGDLLIAGSDQLWNTNYICGQDRSYRLTFAKNIRKLSYATSMNAVKAKPEDLDAIVSDIRSLEAVSVREKSSADYLNEKLSYGAKWVCDPVFLLERKVYESMCIPNPYKNYILVYLASAGEMLSDVVAMFKEKIGCQVISVSGVKPHVACDLHLPSIGPTEMLSLIRGADLVITGSFHASCFSHIFHRPFVVLPPSENAERIQSLLELSGLTSQICRTKEDYSHLNERLDFCESNKRINTLVTASKEWLLSKIGESKDDKKTTSSR